MYLFTWINCKNIILNENFKKRYITGFFTKWGLAQRYIILQISKKKKNKKNTRKTSQVLLFTLTASCDPSDLVVGLGGGGGRLDILLENFSSLSNLESKI